MRPLLLVPDLAHTDLPITGVVVDDTDAPVFLAETIRPSVLSHSDHGHSVVPTSQWSLDALVTWADATYPVLLLLPGR